MDVRLNSDEMREVLAECLMRMLDDKTRHDLIQQSLKQLLERPTNPNYYGNKISPIEQAFVDAARQIAEKEAHKVLNNSPVFQEKLRGMLNEALVKVTETNREHHVNELAKAIALAMTPKERY